jgi:hypothetical protein
MKGKKNAAPPKSATISPASRKVNRLTAACMG